MCFQLANFKGRKGNLTVSLRVLELHSFMHYSGLTLAKAPLLLQLRLQAVFNFCDSTYLNEIQTPHSLFRDFRADKTFTTCLQAAEFKFVSKFEPLPPKDYSRKQLSVLIAKSMAKLLGQCSGTTLAGWTGNHK